VPPIGSGSQLGKPHMRRAFAASFFNKPPARLGTEAGLVLLGNELAKEQSFTQDVQEEDAEILL
jgi:hypothetical protein